MCVSAFFSRPFLVSDRLRYDSIHHFVPTQVILDQLFMVHFEDKSKLVASFKHPCAGYTVFSCALWSPKTFRKLQKLGKERLPPEWPKMRYFSSAKWRNSFSFRGLCPLNSYPGALPLEPTRSPSPLHRPPQVTLIWPLQWTGCSTIIYLSTGPQTPPPLFWLFQFPLVPCLMTWIWVWKPGMGYTMIYLQ